MPYRIKIDRSACTGYAECVGIAPEVSTGRRQRVDGAGSGRDGWGAILDAARACPVDAITLIDEFEEQVWPQWRPPIWL